MSLEIWPLKRTSDPKMSVSIEIRVKLENVLRNFDILTSINVLKLQLSIVRNFKISMTFLWIKRPMSKMIK